MPAPHTEVVVYADGPLTLEGFVAAPSSPPGRLPGVMVVHEWWGHNPYVRRRAEMLAGLGYVGFAVDLYGKGVRAKDPTEAGRLYGAVMTDRTVTRARIGAALGFFRRHPRVEPDKIVCLGYCMGGTASLELARSGADVRGAVSFHGALNTPDPADARNIRCPVLAFHGAADPHVPPGEVAAFRKEMAAAGVDWQLHEFGGAVHSFTNPDAKGDGLKYDPKADARSWEALKLFLAEVFAG
jgi:dienelactone hydrolase